MSQDYKLKFDEMRNNGQAISEDKDNAYASLAHVRKLRFKWPDGRSLSMNYAFLIKHEYEPVESSLTLYYTTDTITIKGSGLNLLDDDLFFDVPKVIEVAETRYGSLSESKTIITEILIADK